MDDLQLGYLLIDTHPGLNELILLSLVMSHILLIVMRSDQQGYEGISVTVKIARELKVPRMLLMVNKTLASLEPEAVHAKLEQAYRCDAAT